MTSEGLGEMFEGDSADMCVGKFPLVSMGGQAEGLGCADPGAMTPIGARGIMFISLTGCLIEGAFFQFFQMIYEGVRIMYKNISLSMNINATSQAQGIHTQNNISIFHNNKAINPNQLSY